MASAKTEVKPTSLRYPGEGWGVWTVLRSLLVISSFLGIIVSPISQISAGGIVLRALILFLFLPYSNVKLKEKTGVEISRWLKLFIFIVLAGTMAQMESKEKILGENGALTYDTFSTQSTSNAPAAANNDVLTDTQSYESKQTPESNLILKPDADLLPTGRELPSEYERGGGPSNITLTNGVYFDTNTGFSDGDAIDGDGFISGAYIGTYTTKNHNIDYLDFYVFRFNSTSAANLFYGGSVKPIADRGGYTEISVSTQAKCFAYQSLSYDVQKSICVRKNIVFETKVRQLGRDETTLKETTKLFDNKVN